MNPSSNPFLWGTATSSHQVEGGNRLNDWWNWEVSGRMAHASGDACLHYSKFKEDFQIISDLGHTAHRLSLEWSRLEPRDGEWDESAFEHYAEVLQDLKSRGIEPVVTLHHFTCPLWFSERGGWEAAGAPELFKRFAERVVKEYKDLVRYWITINEPLVYTYFSYSSGEWPPGKKSFPSSLAVLRNMILAHVLSYSAIHGIYRSAQLEAPRISIAKHLTCFSPYRPGDFRDMTAIYLRNWFANEMVVRALISGFLFFPGVYCELLPGDRTLDFIGVNYYALQFIKAGSMERPSLLGEMYDDSPENKLGLKKNMMGWSICPEGFYQVLLSLRKYQLPVLITENGIATEDDSQRGEYIQSHLKALALSRKQGLEVSGYLHWSLLDNFEWAHGFGPKFGIVSVEGEEKKRKIKPSAYVLSDFCRQF